MARTLKPDEELQGSSIVANCQMNRLRTLEGGNGYEREIGFAPLDVVVERAKSRPARWLDLCCGSGRALVEAAGRVRDAGLQDRVEIVGVDLAGLFDRVPAEVTCLRLVESSAEGWRPGGPFDVITCVHGLHYVGDKLGLLARAASWLGDGGVLVASLDLANFRDAGGRPMVRVVASALRRAGFVVDARRHRVSCRGRREVRLPFRYLGADDGAGPNVTGQPAVDSYYEPA
jgi:SAM-dependent methyltransferase